MIYYKSEKILCHFDTTDLYYSILFAEYNHLIFPYKEFYELVLKDFLKYSIYNSYLKVHLDKYPHIKLKRF